MNTHDDCESPASGRMLALASMREQSGMKNEGWSIMLVDAFPSLSWIPDNLTIGMDGWSCQSQRYRLLKRSSAIDLGGGWITPGDAARMYVNYKYPARRRCTTDQYVSVVKDVRQPPLFAVPLEIDHAVYLDLTSAYWTILRIIGWSVDYHPLKFMGVGDSMDDWPLPDNKQARNALVGIATSSGVRAWIDGKIVFYPAGSRYINMILWRAVQDIMHGIAHDMRRAGAVYVNVDGYIMAKQYERLAYEVAESWGVSLGIRHEGPAVIRGAGNYDIGSRKTRLPTTTRAAIDKIYNPGVDWLRHRVRYWSMVRGVSR